jgi:Cdc6-like AAA superfamily ATPase
MTDYKKLNKAKQVFTPGAPINQKDFFSGRVEQISKVIDAIPSPGVHPVIHGQRGVGKTSLANILGQVLPDVMTIRVGCDSTDTFGSVWDKVLSRASIAFRQKAMGFSAEEITRHVCLRDYIGDRDLVRPGDVANVFAMLKSNAVFILDEFDRITEDSTKAAMADMIKMVSDENPRVTIVLVGVGNTISELVGEHPSISRNLKQIEMPTMPAGEITAILRSGCEKLGLVMDGKVIDGIQNLAGGFPHYAHLLGLACAVIAIEDETTEITESTFHRAQATAAEDAQETLREAFAKATTTTKPSNYSRILVGCGFAEYNDRGVFRATDVASATNSLFGLDLSVPAVTPALGEFSSPDRGDVLEKVPVSNVSLYKFRDPLMRPFLKLKYSTMRHAATAPPDSAI